MDLAKAIRSPEGFVFLPILYRFAAKLEQLEWVEFAQDPAYAALAMRSVQRLLRLEALVSHFRIGIEAEALGANLNRDASGDWHTPFTLAEPRSRSTDFLECPPMSLMLDVTRRLAEELRGQCSIIGVVTGPRTLSGLIADPNDLDRLYAAVSRAHAERGVHALLVAECSTAHEVAAGNDYTSTLKPLFNVASYFRLPTILLDSTTIEPAPGFDLTLSRHGRGTLPLELLKGEPDEPTFWRERNGPLLATEWEVPPDLSAEHLVRWVEALRVGEISK